MFHHIKQAYPLYGTTFEATFSDGSIRRYNTKSLEEKIPEFVQLNDNSLFSKLHVGSGGYGVVWTPDIDLSAEEIWYNGEAIR